MKYSVIELGMGEVDVQISAALCIPRSCSDRLITTEIDSALKSMGTQFNVFSINSDADTYEYPMSWLSYLTTFILITIASLVFVATVRGYKNRKQNKWLESFNIASNTKHFKVREG